MVDSNDITSHQQVFESEKLRLSLVSPQLIEGGRVVAIAVKGSTTFIATEHAIQVMIDDDR